MTALCWDTLDYVSFDMAGGLTEHPLNPSFAGRAASSLHSVIPGPRSRPSTPSFRGRAAEPGIQRRVVHTPGFRPPDTVRVTFFRRSGRVHAGGTSSLRHSGAASGTRNPEQRIRETQRRVAHNPGFRPPDHSPGDVLSPNDCTASFHAGGTSAPSFRGRAAEPGIQSNGFGKRTGAWFTTPGFRPSGSQSGVTFFRRNDCTASFHAGGTSPLRHSGAAQRNPESRATDSGNAPARGSQPLDSAPWITVRADVLSP